MIRSSTHSSSEMNKMDIIFSFDWKTREQDKILVDQFVGFGLVSLFNGISTFVCYLMPKPFSGKNSSGTI